MFSKVGFCIYNINCGKCSRVFGRFVEYVLEFFVKFKILYI